MNRTACGFNPHETTYDKVIKVIGGSYYGNDEQGLLVRLSDKVTIDGAAIFGNMRQSVRIEGAIYIVAKKQHHPRQWTGRYGTAGDDLIRGGPNAEEMQGLDGNDTDIVNKSKGIVIEAVGAGTDDHVFANQNLTPPDHVKHLTIQGDRLPAIHVVSSEDEIVEKKNSVLGESTPFTAPPAIRGRRTSRTLPCAAPPTSMPWTTVAPMS